MPTMDVPEYSEYMKRNVSIMKHCSFSLKQHYLLLVAGTAANVGRIATPGAETAAVGAAVFVSNRRVADKVTAAVGAAAAELAVGAHGREVVNGRWGIRDAHDAVAAGALCFATGVRIRVGVRVGIRVRVGVGVAAGVAAATVVVVIVARASEPDHDEYE